MATSQDSMVAGLFSTPEQYQQAQLAQQQALAAQMAQLIPEQQANAGMRVAGYQLGGGIASALGAQDPMLQAVAARQSILKGIDQTSASSLREAAQKLADIGDLQGASALAQQSVAIQAKIDERQSAREQALQIAKMQIDAKLEERRMAGADKKELALLELQGRKELAAFAASLKGEKPLTEYQGKAVTFGTRAAEANNILNNLAGEYSTMSANYLPSFLNTTKGQQAQQAQQNFVNAVLRQESGAAINSSEFENAKKQYFPQPGDSQAVIDQKKRNRELVIAGFQRQAGPGGKDIQDVFSNPPPKASKTTFSSVAEAEKANLPKGTIITIGGKQAIVE